MGGTMSAIIDEEKCTRCGMCVEVCPVDVFYGTKKGEMPEEVYPEECWFCGACVCECPTDAITLRFPLYAQPSYIAG